MALKNEYMFKEFTDMWKNVAKYGVLIALACIFSWLETLIPFEMIGIPGVKLGLANLVVVVALYYMRPRDAFVISMVRIVLVSFSFGNPYGALYGFAGGVLSFAVMAVIKKTKLFGAFGTSLIGGIFHNVGQIVVAMIVVENVRISYYLPVLMISGAITGAVIGIIAEMVLKRIAKFQDQSIKD